MNLHSLYSKFGFGDEQNVGSVYAEAHDKLFDHVEWNISSDSREMRLLEDEIMILLDGLDSHYDLPRPPDFIHTTKHGSNTTKTKKQKTKKT